MFYPSLLRGFQWELFPHSLGMVQLNRAASPPFCNPVCVKCYFCGTEQVPLQNTAIGTEASHNAFVCGDLFIPGAKRFWSYVWIGFLFLMLQEPDP